MSIFRMGVATLVASVLVGCGGGGSGRAIVVEPEPQPQPPIGLLGDGSFANLVEWVRAKNGIPGMAAMVLVDGQPIDIAATGRRSVAATNPVSENDKWHIGSLTKAMTATLTGVLVEGSYLTWDTTPLDVWPELSGSIHASLRDITIRQLLSHTAGLERTNAVSSPYLDSASGTLAEKRKAFSAEILAKSPAHPVGVHNYSNGGYIVAGAMIETVTGMPWEDALTAFVLAPLGMYDTGYGAPGEPGQLTQPWGHWETGATFDPIAPGPDADNPQVFGPAGTVHTTLSDYATFMAAHIAGARGESGLLSADTFETLHTPIISGAGLGWGVLTGDSFPGLMELAHAGSNQRWYAVVRLIPELNGGAVIVINAGGTRAEDAVDELGDIIVERFENAQ